MRILPFLLLFTACKDVSNPDDMNAEEVVTTVTLNIGDQTAVWEDIDPAGDPIIDSIELPANSTLPFTVAFANANEDPPEDITAEVQSEGDEHQVFFSSTAEIEVAYDDEDAGGLPIGLSNTLTTMDASSGTFTVVLRHLPAEDGTPLKVADLADTFATGGAAALPGDSDADVTFDVTIVP